MLGEVGNLTYEREGDQLTLTAGAVSGTTEYEFEQDFGGGWMAIERDHPDENIELYTLQPNLQTRFRYRATDGEDYTEYSNIVILLYSSIPT